MSAYARRRTNFKQAPCGARTNSGRRAQLGGEQERAEACEVSRGENGAVHKARRLELRLDPALPRSGSGRRSSVSAEAAGRGPVLGPVLGPAPGLG